MQINVDLVKEINNGWEVRLIVKLSLEERSRLNQNLINNFEDYDVNFDGSNIYFNVFVNTEEPWEDESIEELIKAIKIEAEYHTQSFLE
ncbi:MAG: hypothetical protein ACOX08_01870 [Methanobacterium sp.]|jgi:hypothetical protein